MSDSFNEKGVRISSEDDRSPSLGGRYTEHPATTRKLLAKLDAHLLPMVSILYLLSFLDRSNVANARIEGLITDVHMTGKGLYEYLAFTMNTWLSMLTLVRQGTNILRV